MIQESTWKHLALAKFVQMADQELEKPLKNRLDAIYRKTTTSASQPYFEWAEKAGLGLAVEYLPGQEPPKRDPVAGQVFRRDPELIGIQTTIDYPTMANKKIHMITDTGQLVSRALRRKRHYRMIEPLITGFSATSKFKTLENKVLFTTGHGRAGGVTFDSVLSDTTLAFNWTNLLATLKHVFQTHRDGNNWPQEWFEGTIHLVYGPEIMDKVWKALQEHTQPDTANRVKNFIAENFEIMPHMDRLIEGYGWYVLDEEAYLYFFEREADVVWTDLIKSNRNTAVYGSSWYSNCCPLPIGMMGNQGAAS